MMVRPEFANQKAVLRLESLHQEAQTQRLIDRAWRKRWAAWLMDVAERLDTSASTPAAPTLDGGQAVKA